jgi:hypothetical protein
MYNAGKWMEITKLTGLKNEFGLIPFLSVLDLEVGVGGGVGAGGCLGLADQMGILILVKDNRRLVLCKEKGNPIGPFSERDKKELKNGSHYTRDAHYT